MKASHNLARVSVNFDEDRLVPNGGLTVAALLAQKLGVGELVDEYVTLTGPGAGNSGAKALTVVGSALVGGDCIDDANVLRAGATPLLFDGVRAPSTVGTWLRLFIWTRVRQLDRVTRELLRRAWTAGLGPDLDADLTIDIDSSVVETYGLAKQGGAKFSYLGVRGYHPLVASLADTGELLHTRMRGGNATSGKGAASFVAETVARVRDAGARGALTLRADSGFYAGAVVSACRRAGVAFSVTARKNTSIRKAIAAITDEAWTPIPYWVDGGADVAETTYTAFAGTRHQVTCRLLVRRVRPFRAGKFTQRGSGLGSGPWAFLGLPGGGYGATRGGAPPGGSSPATAGHRGSGAVRRPTDLPEWARLRDPTCPPLRRD